MPVKAPPPDFKVGQKVTCVDASNFVKLYGEQVPTGGRTYTVREVISNPNGDGTSCLRLSEINNQARPYEAGVQECSFKASRFAKKTGRP